MRVLLLKDVKGVGRLGEVIETSDGHARNYLIPRGFAKFANESTLKIAAREQEQKEGRQETHAENAKTLARRLTSKSVEFALPADEKGHLYAGLKEKEIFAKITQGGTILPKDARFVDYSPIKTTGSHIAILQIDVQQTVKLNIIVKAK